MMKNNNLTAVSWSRHGLALLLVTGLLAVTGRTQAADSALLTFKYSVVQGTCQVSVPPLVLPDIVPPPKPLIYNKASGFTADGVGKSVSFDVTLSSCSGSAGSKPPSLRITGSHDSFTDSTDKNVLFRDSTSTSQGLGFAFYTTAAATFSAGGSYLADVNGPAGQESHQPIPIPGFVANQPLPSTMTVPLWTNVSIGSKTVPIVAGSLNATITFIFDYF